MENFSDNGSMMNGFNNAESSIDHNLDMACDILYLTNEFNTQSFNNTQLLQSILDQPLFLSEQFNEQQQGPLEHNHAQTVPPNQLPTPLYSNEKYAFNPTEIQSYSCNEASMSTASIAPISQSLRKEHEVFQELMTLANSEANQSEQNYWQFQPTNYPMTPSIGTVKDARMYELKIVQQPCRARMCGFGDKDRRPISPPPIIKLIVKSLDGKVIDPKDIDISFLVVACDSYPITPPKPSSTSPPKHGYDSNKTIDFSSRDMDGNGDQTSTSLSVRNLVGSLVSSASKLYGLDGNLEIFFIFPDISIRCEGSHKLTFSLIDIGSPYTNRLNTQSVSKILEVIETEPFFVYTPKKFPGVVQATPLSVCFSRQGVKIPNRQPKNKSKRLTNGGTIDNSNRMDE